jgi:hypothetical protein
LAYNSGTGVFSIPAATSSQNGYLTSTDWTTFNDKIGGSGTNTYLAMFSASKTLTNSAISYNGSKTTVDAQGLISGNGLELQGNYNSVNGQKLLSNDSTTGYSYMEFSNTGGGFRLGVNRNTAGGILSGSATYATFLTTTGSTSLQFGSNGAMILSLNPSGLARFSNQVQIDNTVTATQFIRSGGTSDQFLKADGSVDSSVYLTTGAASSTYLPLAGGTLTGALSGTSATFSGQLMATAITTSPALKVATSANANSVVLSSVDNSGFGWELQQEEISTGDFRIFRSSASTRYQVLNLARATGAATFSSSVTANGLHANAGNSARFYRSANDYYWGINNDSNNYLNFGTFAANGTAYGTNPKLILLDNGNVGIGTTAATLILDVEGQAATFTGTAFRTAKFSAKSSAVADKPGIVLGYDSSGGGIIAAATESAGQPINFWTYNGSSWGERMRITSAGNVGIGTTAPSQKLDVLGQITYGDGTNYGRIGAIGGETFLASDTGGNNINFYTKPSGGSLTERMRITSDGLLQFSTTSVVPTTNNIIHSYGANGYMYIQGGSTGLALAGSGNRNNAIYVNSSSNIITFVADNAERMRIGSLGFTASVRNASDADSKTFMNSIGSSCGLIPTASGATLYLYSRDGGTNYRALLTSSTYFTGQHGNKVKDLDLKENIENYIGMIVSSDGTYYSVNPITKEVTTGKDAISISEALPEIKLSSKDKDKSVWGVVTNVKNDNYNTDGNIDLDNNTEWGDRLGENVIRVNGLGEGAIWVTNINGNLENGDYICSSIISGYGRKQDDDLLHNYSVAKITMDCDFDLNNNNLYRCEEFEFEGQTYKKAFVGCTYHCS